MNHLRAVNDRSYKPYETLLLSKASIRRIKIGCAAALSIAVSFDMIYTYLKMEEPPHAQHLPPLRWNHELPGHHLRQKPFPAWPCLLAADRLVAASGSLDCVHAADADLADYRAKPEAKGEDKDRGGLPELRIYAIN